MYYKTIIERAKQHKIKDYLNTDKDQICCPLPNHNDKTASFKIYEKTNSFYCFGCNTGGDVIKLVQEINGFSFKEAVKELTGDNINLKQTTIPSWNEQQILQYFSKVDPILIETLLSSYDDWIDFVKSFKKSNQYSSEINKNMLLLKKYINNMI